MKFTKIIPCYNVQDYVSTTIESVINQTYRNLEIILVNDGSTDKTFNILNIYANSDKRIILIDKKNGGVSSARNEGIRKATGDYLFFLDGDDVIAPKLFEKINNILHSNKNIDFISFGYKIEKNGKLLNIFSHKELDKKIFQNNQLLLFFLQKKLRQSISSFVIKKDIVIDNEILFDENTTNGEDQEFQIKCMYHSEFSYYIADMLFIYLRRDNSATSKFSIKHLTLLDAFERLLNYIDKDSNKEIYENIKTYALFVYFYLLKKAVKSNDKNLIKLVIKRFKDFDNNVEFPKNRLALQTLILKILFKISPKLLQNILKRV